MHFVYHQQEAGAFIQDQYKFNPRFSITPGLRYDWLNFLATKRLGFSPRVSFAWVLDEHSKTVVRGGASIIYSSFVLDTFLAQSDFQNSNSTSLAAVPTGAIIETNGLGLAGNTRTIRNQAK